MKKIFANLKMNLLGSDLKKYIDDLESENFKNQLVIFPTSIFLPYFLNKKFEAGIQNVYFEKNGSFTGEVSAEQIKSLKVNYAIVGHSERRKYFSETNEIISEKTTALLSENLIPVICVGESLKERKSGKTFKILKEQIKTFKDKENIIVAYEPIWAIGTGVIPSEEELLKTANMLKKELGDTPLLYGGSVNEDNIEFLEKLDCFDGYLIGGASLKPETLAKIDNIIE